MREIRTISIIIVFLSILIALPSSIHAGNIEAQLPSSDGSDAFQVQDYGGTPLLHVQSDGNIGIGTSSPAQKLDVIGHIHATDDICTDAGGGTCLSSVSGGIGSLTGIPQNIQIFTNNGTWIKPANISTVYVKVWGAGGRGGDGGPCGWCPGGGGGGAGGYAEGIISVSGNVAVTVGIGGTGDISSGIVSSSGTASSFAGDTTIWANGGGGGQYGRGDGSGGSGGSGGSASGGSININGQSGDPGGGGAPSSVWYGGSGGASFGSGRSASGKGSFPGGGGSGGSGGLRTNVRGDGADGIVIVYY